MSRGMAKLSLNGKDIALQIYRQAIPSIFQPHHTLLFPEGIIEKLKKTIQWREITACMEQLIDMCSFLGITVLGTSGIFKCAIEDTFEDGFTQHDAYKDEQWRQLKNELHLKKLDVLVKETTKVKSDNPWIHKRITWGDFSISIHNARSIYTENISWGTLSTEVINWLRLLYTNDTFHKILEVGAGHGFNAMLLEKAGIPIVATDEKAYDQTFTMVEICDGVEAIQKHNECDCLLMVWPPYEEPFAYKCLTAFNGHHLFYVGEDEGGCTGDNTFFEELTKNWKQECYKHVPKFAGMHDYFFYYTRIEK